MEEIRWARHEGVRSEVGTLRTVMLHRPGAELRRMNPRNAGSLLFDGMPWVARAQEEHDAFAQVLRDRGVQVLILAELLAETLAIPEAREWLIEHSLNDLHFGTKLRSYLKELLEDSDPELLAQTLMAGLRNDELVNAPKTLVTSTLPHDEFILRPLPNLLFTRDSSVWIGDHPAITSLFYEARQRENHITEAIYTYHPVFHHHEPFYGWDKEHIEGGDILALSDGVLAVGVSERTTPAGVERLARAVFKRGIVHTIVAVPMQRERAMMHLDTICTMVDVDKVVMYPNIAETLTGIICTSDEDYNLEVGDPMPFLQAAAQAMGLDQITAIDTGLDPHEAEREQWDDGNNTLAIAPKVVIAYERNDGTNARLESAGIEVIRIAGSELGSGRGGPRCMSCPIARDHV